MKKTNTLISLCILTSSVILPSYVSATTQNSSMPSSLTTEKSNSINTPSTSTTGESNSINTASSSTIEESDSENVQIPDITISRKSSSQYAGISLWVSAKITTTENNIIKKGTKIIISGVSKEYFDFTNWSFVDGSSYGEYSVDAEKGQLIYTFSTDINFAGSFTLNWFIPTKTVQETSDIQTLTGQYVNDKNSTDIDIENSKFQVTKTPGGGAVETRVQANSGNEGNIAVDDNSKGVSSEGYSIYDPNQKYLPVTYVLDPGNLTPSQTNRTYTISGTGPESKIIPTLIRVSIRDLGGTNYLTLDQAKSDGYLNYSVNDDGSISIVWKDGIKINGNRINVPLYAPDVSGKYSVTSTYTADTYYPGIAIQTLTNKVAYVPGSSGFIPKILGASDRELKQGEDIIDIDSWLLSGVTATDLTDGDLTSKVEVLNSNELKNAWKNHINGEFQITYSIKNSQNQIATKQVKVIVYSDITIHYQDDSGNKLKDDLILSGNPGDTYTVDNTDVIFNNKNYYFVSSNPSALTGKYGSQGQPSEITLTYKGNKQSINGSDYSMTLGDKKPTISDFKASATDKAGNTLDVTADLTKVDFTKAGTYDVVLNTTDGQSKTVKLTIRENKQSINGSDYSMTLGDKKPTISDFKASATDKAGNTLDVTADFSKVDFTKVGTYDVVLNTTDGQSKTVKLTIRENKQSINGSDYSMALGDKEPTVSDFKASATDKAGNTLDVTADLTKVDFTKVGTYDVVLTTTDGQSKTVKLTIKNNKASVIDHNNNKDKSNPSSGKNILSNNSKASLPSTGEQKTNLFYGLGAMLIILALAIYGGLKKIRKKN